MRKNGLFLIKKGMIGIWEGSKRIGVTLMQLPKTTVVERKEGRYLAFIEHGSKASKPELGILKKNNITEKVNGFFKELKTEQVDDTIQEFDVSFFHEGQIVDVSGISKGKGFEGVVKRHGFKGGRASHGNSLSHRSHGSTGMRQEPARVFKNKKMAGHMGATKVTQQNLVICKIIPEENVILVKGSVPGSKNSLVFVRNAIKNGVNE